MNNNRNNRRRGRGNRNQGGGGNQNNRIDSRARGNAPQLLDKYKKLAQDAQHNGDRVQAEYYLQFADHYFRVIADNKARQDEARAKRDAERGQSDDDDSDDDGDDNRRSNRRARGRGDDNDRQGGDQPKLRQPKPRRGQEGEEADPGDNPFAKKAGAKKSAPKDASKEAGDEKPKRRTRQKANGKDEGSDSHGKEAGGDFDASVLPPSISGDDASPKSGLKPRRRAKADDADGSAKAVNS